MAAGFSRRFGQQDKRTALLPSGQPLLGQLLTGLQGRFKHLAVVIRPEDDPAVLAIPDGVHILRAANAAEGLGASIADGVDQLLAIDLPGIESLALMLGDMPVPATSTLALLLENQAAARIVRPIYQPDAISADQKQPGHPVLFGREFWLQLTRLSGEDGAKAVIRNNRDCLTLITVNDVRVLQDVDQPDALLRYPAS